jgi:hypothetical protein
VFLLKEKKKEKEGKTRTVLNYPPCKENNNKKRLLPDDTPPQNNRFNFLGASKERWTFGGGDRR